MRILTTAAHPGDERLGAGGTSRRRLLVRRGRTAQP